MLRYEILPGSDAHDTYYQKPFLKAIDLHTGDDLDELSGFHDIYARIKYLSSNEIHGETLVAALDGPKLVGAVGLQVNPYNEDEIWLKYISVDEDYKRQGIARELYFKAADYVDGLGKKIERSSATEDGRMYLGKIVAEIHEKYPSLLTNPPGDANSPPGPHI